VFDVLFILSSVSRTKTALPTVVAQTETAQMKQMFISVIAFLSMPLIVTERYVEGKVITLQSCTGPEGTRRLRFQIKTVCT